MKSKASIAGHPIHPMLIPFPLALWATSFVVDILFYFLRHPTLLVVAKFMIAAGCLGAIAAAIPGFIDWLSIKNGDVKKAANLLQLPVSTLYRLIDNLALDRSNATTDPF